MKITTDKRKKFCCFGFVAFDESFLMKKVLTPEPLFMWVKIGERVDIPQPNLVSWLRRTTRVCQQVASWLCTHSTPVRNEIRSLSSASSRCGTLSVECHLQGAPDFHRGTYASTNIAKDVLLSTSPE